MTRNLITQLGPRDRWLMALLPGLLVMTGYVFGFDWPNTTAVRNLDAKVDAARKQAPAAERIQAQRADLARLNDAIRLRKSSSAASARLANPKSWSTPAERPVVLAALSRWMETHHVAVAATARLGDADAGARWASKLREVPPQAGTNNRGAQPEAWKIDLVCDYGAMQGVLGALPLLDRIVVPLELSMEKADRDTPLRHWSLVIGI